MDSGTIREQIINYVIIGTEASSLSGIHISKLVKELGINRNTFYYHFDSKLDVAMYVFRVDLARELGGGSSREAVARGTRSTQDKT